MLEILKIISNIIKFFKLYNEISQLFTNRKYADIDFVYDF